MDSERCGGIDLHIHSSASDGTYSPAEIIHMAAKIGLDAISITDHDTLDGSRQALQATFPDNLRFITGVEISAAVPPQTALGGGIHLLGYGVDPEDSALTQTLDRYTGIRERRIHRIVDRLHFLGVELRLEHVLAEVGDGVAGRPHVAAAMIKAGLARNVDDAFERYLGNGRPAYVGKERLDCRLAFELIANAGGVPVLAHPYLIECRDESSLEVLIAQLCEMGLRGIEVYYPQHSTDAVARYLALADTFNLVVTGGTDFHGHLTPDINLGCGRGDLHVPSELFNELRLHCPPGSIR